MSGAAPNERLAKVEEAQSSIAREVHALSTKIDSLTIAIGRQQRTPWGILIAGCGTMLALVGGLWAFGMQPIQLQFQEVETQFRITSMLRNVLHESNERHIQMLWHKVYGEDMPGLSYWPEVGEGR